MHRTIHRPRLLALRLAFVLVLLASTISLSAWAQEAGTVLIVPINTTKLLEMSSKQLIKEVRSDNPNVASVVVDTPRSALVTARNAGITRIFLTDTTGVEEFAEINVPSDAERRRQETLSLIRKTVPTATVDLTIVNDNSVIATGHVGSAENVQIIDQLIKSRFSGVVNAMQLSGVQQVQLDVIVALVNRTEARNLSFSFLQTGQNYFLASTIGGAGSLAASTVASVLAPTTALTSAPNAVFGVVNDKNGFIGFLNALRTEGLAKLVARPSVMTLSGRPAQFVSGGETPILTSSGTGAPSVSYKQFGTVVDFLPIVLGNGKIHLEVSAQISSLNAASGVSITTGASVTSVPGFDTRSARVTVQMQDGETLAIGGLIQNTISGTTTKVPVLGDLPFFGAAFRSMSYSEKEEELVILVTPRLVDPIGCDKLPKYLPGQETRTPDDFELFLEGILEAPRGQRSPCMGKKYYPSHQSGPTTGLFPCGDNGRPCWMGRCGTSGCQDGSCKSGAVTTMSQAVRPDMVLPNRMPPVAQPSRPLQQPRTPNPWVIQGNTPNTQMIQLDGIQTIEIPGNDVPMETGQETERPNTLPDPAGPPTLGPVAPGEGPVAPSEGPVEPQENVQPVESAPEPGTDDPQ